MIVWATLTAEAFENVPRLAERITAQDRAHAAQRKMPHAQHLSLMARACLRALLYQTTGRSDWAIAFSPQGKPYLLAMDENAAPHISLSHTKGIVACAVSTESPIGIDIEIHRQRRFADIAAMLFTPEEQRIVAAEGADAFYKFWTQREAKAKAVGQSVFALSPDNCALFSAKIDENHSLAVASCTEKTVDETRYRNLSVAELTAEPSAAFLLQATDPPAAR